MSWVVETRVALARCSPTRLAAVLASTRGGSTLTELRPLWGLRRRWGGIPGQPSWVPAPSEAGRLRFATTIALPGQVTLDYTLTPEGAVTRVTQTLRWLPAGLRGRLYWRLVQPAHRLVFRAMLAGVIRRAEAASRA